MSTATLEVKSLDSVDDTLQYRAVHIGAIAGCAMAVLLMVFTLIAAGGSAEGCIAVAILNTVPLSFCLWALGRIRREPDQYTGRSIALTGLVLSLASLVGGVAYGGFVYATEVPDGYQRITFGAMKPSDVQERSGVTVPPDIAELHGKKVFIKGYIRPDSVTVSRGIKRFLLVRDNNQCCFGDLSSIKYYDQIDVDMLGSRRVDYHEGLFRIGGVLHVEPQNVGRASLAPVFSLKADHAN